MSRSGRAQLTKGDAKLSKEEDEAAAYARMRLARSLASHSRELVVGGSQLGGMTHRSSQVASRPAAAPGSGVDFLRSAHQPDCPEDLMTAAAGGSAAAPAAEPIKRRKSNARTAAAAAAPPPPAPASTAASGSSSSARAIAAAAAARRQSMIRGPPSLSSSAAAAAAAATASSSSDDELDDVPLAQRDISISAVRAAAKMREMSGSQSTRAKAAAVAGTAFAVASSLMDDSATPPARTHVPAPVAVSRPPSAVVTNSSAAASATAAPARITAPASTRIVMPASAAARAGTARVVRAPPPAAHRLTLVAPDELSGGDDDDPDTRRHNAAYDEDEEEHNEPRIPESASDSDQMEDGDSKEAADENEEPIIPPAAAAAVAEAEDESVDFAAVAAAAMDDSKRPAIYGGAGTEEFDDLIEPTPPLAQPNRAASTVAPASSSSSSSSSAAAAAAAALNTPNRRARSSLYGYYVDDAELRELERVEVEAATAASWALAHPDASASSSSSSSAAAAAAAAAVAPTVVMSTEHSPAVDDGGDAELITAIPLKELDAAAAEAAHASLLRKLIREEVCETCSICMEPLIESVVLLRCGHMFHRVCITNWLGAGKADCPLDRTPVRSFPVPHATPLHTLKCPLVPNVPNATSDLYWLASGSRANAAYKFYEIQSLLYSPVSLYADLIPQVLTEAYQYTKAAAAANVDVEGDVRLPEKSLDGSGGSDARPTGNAYREMRREVESEGPDEREVRLQRSIAQYSSHEQTIRDKKAVSEAVKQVLEASKESKAVLDHHKSMEALVKSEEAECARLEIRIKKESAVQNKHVALKKSAEEKTHAIMKNVRASEYYDFVKEVGSNAVKTASHSNEYALILKSARALVKAITKNEKAEIAETRAIAQHKSVCERSAKALAKLVAKQKAADERYARHALKTDAMIHELRTTRGIDRDEAIKRATEFAAAASAAAAAPASSAAAAAAAAASSLRSPTRKRLADGSSRMSLGGSESGVAFASPPHDPMRRRVTTPSPAEIVSADRHAFHPPPPSESSQMPGFYSDPNNEPYSQVGVAVAAAAAAGASSSGLLLSQSIVQREEAERRVLAEAKIARLQQMAFDRQRSNVLRSMEGMMTAEQLALLRAPAPIVGLPPRQTSSFLRRNSYAAPSVANPVTHTLNPLFAERPSFQQPKAAPRSLYPRLKDCPPRAALASAPPPVVRRAVSTNYNPSALPQVIIEQNGTKSGVQKLIPSADPVHTAAAKKAKTERKKEAKKTAVAAAVKKTKTAAKSSGWTAPANNPTIAAFFGTGASSAASSSSAAAAAGATAGTAIPVSSLR